MLYVLQSFRRDCNSPMSGYEDVIAFVFPKMRHKWCLWHIMKKISEKVARLYPIQRYQANHEEGGL